MQRNSETRLRIDDREDFDFVTESQNPEISSIIEHLENLAPNTQAQFESRPSLAVQKPQVAAGNAHDSRVLAQELDPGRVIEADRIRPILRGQTGPAILITEADRQRPIQRSGRILQQSSERVFEFDRLQPDDRKIFNTKRVSFEPISEFEAQPMIRGRAGEPLAEISNIVASISEFDAHEPLSRTRSSSPKLVIEGPPRGPHPKHDWEQVESLNQQASLAIAEFETQYNSQRRRVHDALLVSQQLLAEYETRPDRRVGGANSASATIDSQPLSEFDSAPSRRVRASRSRSPPTGHNLAEYETLTPSTRTKSPKWERQEIPKLNEFQTTHPSSRYKHRENPKENQHTGLHIPEFLVPKTETGENVREERPVTSKGEAAHGSWGVRQAVPSSRGSPAIVAEFWGDTTVRVSAPQRHSQAILDIMAQPPRLTVVPGLHQPYDVSSNVGSRIEADLTARPTVTSLVENGAGFPTLRSASPTQPQQIATPSRLEMESELRRRRIQQEMESRQLRAGLSENISNETPHVPRIFHSISADESIPARPPLMSQRAPEFSQPTSYRDLLPSTLRSLRARSPTPTQPAPILHENFPIPFDALNPTPLISTLSDTNPPTFQPHSYTSLPAVPDVRVPMLTASVPASPSPETSTADPPSVHRGLSDIGNRMMLPWQSDVGTTRLVGGVAAERRGVDEVRKTSLKLPSPPSTPRISPTFTSWEPSLSAEIAAETALAGLNFTKTPRDQIQKIPAAIVAEATWPVLPKAMQQDLDALLLPEPSDPPPYPIRPSFFRPESPAAVAVRAIMEDFPQFQDPNTVPWWFSSPAAIKKDPFPSFPEFSPEKLPPKKVEPVKPPARLDGAPAVPATVPPTENSSTHSRRENNSPKRVLRKEEVAERKSNSVTQLHPFQGLTAKPTPSVDHSMKFPTGAIRGGSRGLTGNVSSPGAPVAQDNGGKSAEISQREAGIRGGSKGLFT